MQKSKIIGIAVGTVLFVAVILLYPQFQGWQHARAEKAIQSQVADLQKLIFDKNCPKVVEQAGKFLKQYPKATEVWHLQGVCQFDLAKFDQAKVSFEKVLSFDPNHLAAKNYLKNLEAAQSHINTIVTAAELPYERGAYEARLGVKFNDQILRFEKVVKRPSNIPEFLRASYTRLGNFADTVSYVKTELGKVSTQISQSEGEGGTIFSTRTDTEMRIIVIEQATSTVVVEYQKFK